MPGFTRANLRRLEGKDPVAATLASIVSSLPASKTTPTPGVEVANARVKACRRAARKDLSKMFGATWGEETFGILYCEMDWPASTGSSEWELDWVSEEPAPSKDPKEHECLKPGPSSRAVAPEPNCVDTGWPPRMAAPELALNETLDLLSRVLGAGDEDPDLIALSASLKTKLGLSDLKKPPPTTFAGVELLTRDVNSCTGIRSCPMDTCPSPVHSSVRTVPVCSVGDTTEVEMKGYGLAALAPVANLYRSPPSGGTGDPGVPGRQTKAIATASLQIELLEFDPKILPEWAQDQRYADVPTKCTLIKKSCIK